MKNRFSTPARRALLRAFAFAAVMCLLVSPLAAQQTASDTVISNRATATYSDGSGGSFSAVSNTVEVTVAKVSGLVITGGDGNDPGTRPAVVSGQTAQFAFRVTNTGNFGDKVSFLANGASIQVSSNGTITGAVIDVNNDNLPDAGDTNIFTNSTAIESALINQNASIQILVRVNVSTTAASGDTVSVTLGDADNAAPYDNETPENPATPSAHEVRTVSTASVNGVREARGTVNASVETDAQLLLTMTAPTTDVALGANITYSFAVSNPGLRDAQASVDANGNGTIEPGEAQTLGGVTGIFVIAPIPDGTAFASGQTFPAGTVLYTTSALSVDPLQAVWTTTQPGDLTQITRIAFLVGQTLTAGAPPVTAINGTATAMSFQVTVDANRDASQPIAEIADAFARNSLGATIDDQSGDATPNAGDGNANFDEGDDLGSTDGNGVMQRTPLIVSGSVLIGPFNRPDATNTTNNDDFTNRSSSTGINVAPGVPTNAIGEAIFTNTVKNTGNATDDLRISAPTAPANFTVEVSLDNGSTWTAVQPGNGSMLLEDVAPNATVTVWVKVIAPATTAVLTGYPVTIQADSTNVSGQFNQTINRLYTGFMRMDKTATVSNGTGTGGANDAVPGADIIYTITYTNVSAANPVGNTSNATLTASNIVITEDGNVGNADPTNPNNWGDTTTHVSAENTRGGTSDGTITGNTVGSTSYVVNPTPLTPGQVGIFTFRRKIK